MARKLRAAVVGLGQIGSRYAELRKGVVTHAQMYASDPAFSLVAGCDPDARQRRLFAKKYPHASVYPDIRTMMEDSHPEIVSVASPAHVHVQNIAEIFKYPLKAVFCEKPVAHEIKDALAIEKILKKKQTYFLVNHSRRFDHTHRRMASDIQSQKYGQPRLIEAYVSGNFPSMASHMLDTILWFFGEVLEVQTLGPFQSIDSPGTIRLLLKNGAQAWIHPLPAKDHLIYELDMYFSKGRVRLTENGFSSLVWKKAKSPRFPGYFSLKPVAPYGAGYRDVFENAAACLKKRTSNPSGLAEGMAVLRLMDAIQRSGRSKSRIISLQ